MSPRPSIGHHIASTAVGLFVFVLMFVASANILPQLVHVSPTLQTLIDKVLPFVFAVATGILGYLTNLHRNYRSLRLDSGQPPKHPPGHCQTCGYNLTGNTSGRCPECGESP